MERLSPRALERRLKRRLRKVEHRFFAPCAPGFEGVLAAEVAALPEVGNVAAERGGVNFAGPLDTVYHANLWLRSAHRVLLRLDTFPARNEPTLYDRVRRLPWELYLGYAPSYRVRVSSKRSRLNHRRAVAETVAAGIRAALEPLGLHPEARLTPSNEASDEASDEAEVTLFLRLFEDRCTLSLDTSGEHLHKRGYRPLTGAAPLRETLAASVLLSLPWRVADPDPPLEPLLLDPMCGSGTLLIEAALIASHTAPGLRRTFAFEVLPFFQPEKWARLCREAEATRCAPSWRFIGNDLDPAALAWAQASAERAEVSDWIHWRQGDARTLAPPAPRGSMVSNVPYGVRLGTPATSAAILDAFGAHLAAHFHGWRFAFISRELGWLERPGLAVGSSLRFRNGGVPVTLVTGEVLTPAP